MIARNRGGNKCGQVSVGEEVEVVGLDLGQAGGHSAICPLGRDPDGCSVLEEDSVVVSDGQATPTFVPAIHGFLEGGGLIQASTNSLDMDTAIQGTVPQLRIFLCNLSALPLAVTPPRILI